MEGSLDTDPEGGAADSRMSAQTEIKVLLLQTDGRLDVRVYNDEQMSHLSVPHQQYSCD